MNALELRASEALAVAIAAVEVARDRCVEAGCDGYDVYRSIEQALADLQLARRTVEGKV